MEANDMDERLAALHDEYVERVNMLLDEGRDDLARRAADEYEERALRLLSAAA